MAGREVRNEKPGKVSPARGEAFAILLKVAGGDAHSDDLLLGRRVSKMSAQDRNLCTALVLGVLRWQLYIDARVRPLLAKPNAKLDDAVAIALRMGAFQLWFLDRIPAHAAISESVELTRVAGHKFASGMVNAVLRKAAALGRDEALDVRAAFPAWLVERWVARYGEAVARAICAQGQVVPEMVLRLAEDGVEAELHAEGVECGSGVILTAARRLLSGDVTAGEAFGGGSVRIQEEGSQLVAELSRVGGFAPRRILDCCAAPGGKTLVMMERNPEAWVTACEVSERRFQGLWQRLDAAQSGEACSVEVLLGDVTELAFACGYDFVLADVPCSGTGTLGRNPEIRHRVKPEDLARHHARQCAILRAALKAASSEGARVVYSTCSLEVEENEAVVAEVLAESPGWQRVDLEGVLEELVEKGRVTHEGLGLLRSCVSDEGALMLLPGSLGDEHATDGFFMAMMCRV